MSPNDLPKLRLDDQLCFSLYAANHLMMRVYRPLLDELGLTYPQYLVMLVLWETTPCTVGDLGHRLHLDSGTLTPLLKRLEAAGLVARKRDPQDERRVQVGLTTAGEVLRESARHIPEAMLCRTKLPLADSLALRDELKQLINALQHAAPHLPNTTTPQEIA